jgi:hypothetical protein
MTAAHIIYFFVRIDTCIPAVKALSKMRLSCEKEMLDDMRFDPKTRERIVNNKIDSRRNTTVTISTTSNNQKKVEWYLSRLKSFRSSLLHASSFSDSSKIVMTSSAVTNMFDILRELIECGAMIDDDAVRQILKPLKNNYAWESIPSTAKEIISKKKCLVMSVFFLNSLIAVNS